MESIAEEMVREILLKLPTREVIRCRGVSRQWRGLLTDTSFIDLHAHAAHVVSGPGAEALVVATEIGATEIVIINALSGKPMYRVTGLDTSYRPANACNGFLLLASGVENKPVYVCNPATGEKQKISPQPETAESVYSRSYAMGFSPSTGQYKLFRLCFRASAGWPEEHYMEAYTLGDIDEAGSGSWRRHPHTFRYIAAPQQPPVLVDGKLYVLTKRPESLTVPKAPDRMLVIDVASEAHGTYRLPEELTGEVTAAVTAFELRGRLCVARRVARDRQHQLLHFWVMEPLRRRLDQKKDRSMYARWELRYTFYMGCGGRHDDRPSGAWMHNGDWMLCYRLGDSLYMYNTNKDNTQDMEQKKVGDLSLWHHMVHLTVEPSAYSQRWNVYGGYRPSLLSPHSLAFRRKDDEQDKQSQHDLGHAKQSSKKRCSMCPPPDCDNHPVLAAKRVDLRIQNFSYSS